VPTGSLSDLAPLLHLTPAFAHRYERDIVGSPISYVRIRPRQRLESFQLAVERLAAGKPVSFISTRENQSAKVQRSIDVSHSSSVTLVIGAMSGGERDALGIPGESHAEYGMEPGRQPGHKHRSELRKRDCNR